MLASSHSVTEAIQTLAAAIGPWLAQPSDQPPVIVVLLEGGRYFADRLSSELHAASIHFDRVDLKVSTRDGDGRPLPSATITGDIDSLRGRRVLIADDILDSGITLRLTRDRLGEVVGELKSAMLVQKNDPAAIGPDERPAADYVGLTFTDSRWFSGVGMDMPGDPEGAVRNASLIIAYPPVFG